jgi:hypothetical protein
MLTDVAGRVKNTSFSGSRPLLPLYEAVVNSIDAIEDAAEKKGRIDIAIVRDSKHLFGEQAPELGEITGFEVTDNGIGFDDENFHAFETSDTTYKAPRGGKGIGRFLWLVAFERVEVVSHFRHDRQMRCRRFAFVPEGDGVRDMTVEDSTEKKRSTTVRLIGFRAKYQQQCPKRLDTVATHLIDHCLEYFIRPDCPEIVLEDRSSAESVKLNERFEREMATKSKPDQVLVEGHSFDVLHVRLYSAHATDHLIHFCANSRVVKSEKLLGQLPNLARRLQDQDGRDFLYAAYVDSKVLDEAVNAERTEFSITEDDSELLVKDITWGAIRAAVFASCRSFLRPYTEPVRERKQRRIENFVASDGPMYRPILKYIGDKLDRIEADIDDDKLDLELYKAYHDLQVTLRTQGQQLLQKEARDDEWDEFFRQLQEYFDKVSDINKSDLARYVCHRRAVLDFLHKQLSFTESGKYRREERIHQIIFPLRKTSDEVPIEEHNLWVLDEKLVYHAFLASDKPLRTHPQLDTDSRKEPDLVVFDKACAFAPATDPPFPAIVVVEFKRPMRNDYSETDNPVVQVLDYVRDIRDGNAKTPTGRNIPIGKDIPFFCYVVADITPTLTQQAKYLDLAEMPDGQGFFGFRKQFNAYVEVLSYSKILSDAKKRNAVFFRTLGLPDRIGQ